MPPTHQDHRMWDFQGAAAAICFRASLLKEESSHAKGLDLGKEHTVARARFPIWSERYNPPIIQLKQALTTQRMLNIIWEFVPQAFYVWKMHPIFPCLMPVAFTSKGKKAAMLGDWFLDPLSNLKICHRPHVKLTSVSSMGLTPRKAQCQNPRWYIPPSRDPDPRS